MFKFAAILAMVCTQASAFAAPSGHFYGRQMRLSGADSELLFDAMTVDTRIVDRAKKEIYLLKEAQVGDVESGFRLRLVCELRGRNASCDVYWITTAELVPGMDVTLPQEFSREAMAALSISKEPLALEPFSLVCDESLSKGKGSTGQSVCRLSVFE